jgi:hypothetical protein
MASRNMLFDGKSAPELIFESHLQWPVPLIRIELGQSCAQPADKIDRATTMRASFGTVRMSAA